MKKKILRFCSKKYIYVTDEECLDCFKSGHSGFSNHSICKSRNITKVIHGKDKETN